MDGSATLVSSAAAGAQALLFEAVRRCTVTIQWFLLTALLVGLILLLFRFVGCAQIAGIRDPDPTTLNLFISEPLVSPDFPKVAPPQPQQVLEVEVTWKLFKVGSPVPPVVLKEIITSQKDPPPVPPVLDPTVDRAERPISDSMAKNHDLVTCDCLITGESGATATTNTASMPLAVSSANIFRLHVNHRPSTEPQ